MTHRHYLIVNGQRVPVFYGSMSDTEMPYVTITATGPRAKAHVDGIVPITTVVIRPPAGRARRILRRRKATNDWLTIAHTPH